jgi:AcrR family transcriptional regulator
MTGKTSPTKTDPRVRRTRRILRDALISLILEKDFASISIRELTDRADVAYITFFRHYESLDALLMEVLEEGLADLLVHIETLAKQSDTTRLETEGLLIFEYIQKKSDLFRILFKSQSVARIRKTVLQKISAIFQNSCAPLQHPKSPIPLKMAGNHMATSLLALIEWWLENKMSPPPAQMGKIYKRLIIDATVGAVMSI